MNEKTKRTIDKIKKMPYSTYVQQNNIRNIHDIENDNSKQIRKKKAGGLFRYLAYIFLGYGSKESVARSNVQHSTSTNNSSTEWRKTQSLEDYYWERERMADYFSSIDGKGDPEHCNCDHDHDDR